MHILHPRRLMSGQPQQDQPQHQVQVPRFVMPPMTVEAQAHAQAHAQAQLMQANAAHQAQAHAQTQAMIAQQNDLAARKVAFEALREGKQVDWRLLDDSGGVRQNVGNDLLLEVGCGAKPLVGVFSESGNACTVAISIDVTYNPNGATLPDDPDADILISLQWGTSRGLCSAELTPGNGITFPLTGSMFQISAKNTGNVPMHVRAGIGVGPIALQDEPKRAFRDFDVDVGALAVAKYGYKVSATRLPNTSGVVVHQFTDTTGAVALSTDTIAVPGSSVADLILSPFCRAVSFSSPADPFTRIDPFFYLSL